MDFGKKGVYSSYTSSIIANDPTITKVAYGIRTSYFGEALKSKRYITIGKEILNSGLPDHQRFSIGYEFPLKGSNKILTFEGLPDYLKDKFWSCRRPQGNEPCGTCGTCQEFKKYNVKHPVFNNE